MKNIDLTGPVMEKIVSLESSRTKREKRRIFLVIFLILTAITGAVMVITNSVISRGTSDLLALFGEDMEIISEYWQDTFYTIWEELPQRVFISGLFLAVFLIIFLIITSGRRRLIRRKIDNIRKYRDNKKEKI